MAPATTIWRSRPRRRPSGSRGGHRVRAELFLKGRYKGMSEEFLRSDLRGSSCGIPYAYKIAEPVTRSPEGFAGVIERDLIAQAKREKEQKK